MAESMEASEHSMKIEGLRRDLGHETDAEGIIDLLMRYISDPSHRALSNEEIIKVEHLLSSDPRWNEVAEHLRDEYSRMVDSVGRSEIPKILKPNPASDLLETLKSAAERFFTIHSVRYAVASAICVVLLYSCTAIVSRITTPATVALAKIGQESLAVRGRQNIPTEAVNALQAGRYDEAIDRLTALTLARSDSETTALNNYLLGIAFLHSAERSIIGFFPRYDRSAVLEGIRHLQISLRSAGNSPEYNDFQDGCRFALGKAALMLDDIPKAESYFLQVNERSNPYRMPARILLSSLSR